MNDKEPRIWVDRTRLTEMMRRRGLNGKALALKWGKHYNNVYRVKKAGTLPLSELATLCAALECSPIELLRWEGLPDHDPNFGQPGKPLKIIYK